MAGKQRGCNGVSAGQCGMGRLHDVSMPEQGFPVRAVVGEVFGVEGSCSCGAPEDLRRSSEEKLCCGDPFDHAHSSATDGAPPGDAGLIGPCRCCWRRAFRGAAQQLEAERKQTGAPAVGEEAEVTDAYEATWQHMKEKPPQELIGGQRHQPLFVAMGGVAPTKRHLPVLHGNESVVGNS